MKKRSKRYRDLMELFDKNNKYSIDEAIELIKKFATAKFDESVDVAVNLGINPKKAEENVRSTVVLPNGTGKKVRVLVFTQGDKQREAEEAGAEYSGLDDYIEKIQNGWLEFDAVVATPDVMRFVGRLGKILGPKGLMPNPKVGTVTFDVADTVKKLKAGRIEFRADKYGVMKLLIGRTSFPNQAIKENLIALLKAIMSAKPTTITSRYQYLKNVYLNSTMGPGIEIDLNEVWNM